MQSDATIWQSMLLHEEGEASSSSSPLQCVVGSETVRCSLVCVAERGEIEFPRQQPQFMQSPLGGALGCGLPGCLKNLEGAMAIPNARAIETMQVRSARGIFRRYLHLFAILEANRGKNPVIALEILNICKLRQKAVEAPTGLASRCHEHR